MKNNILKFLKKLRLNNSREWMHENEDLYKAIKAERDLTAQRFIDAIATIDPEAAGYPVEKSVYRLMRDTRFSSDKTPYKTHIGIFVCPPLGKKSLLSGYYLHLEPGNCLLCGGNYALPSKHLAVIRNEIRDNIEEYLSIVESEDFKVFFPKVGEMPLKTSPKGFDRDWAYIDYVRPREFCVTLPLADTFFDTPDFPERLIPALTQIKRYNDFINFSLTESGLPLLRPSTRR